MLRVVKEQTGVRELGLCEHWGVNGVGCGPPKDMSMSQSWNLYYLIWQKV